jgi:hypothetical protein
MTVFLTLNLKDSRDAQMVASPDASHLACDQLEDLNLPTIFFV